MTAPLTSDEEAVVREIERLFENGEMDTGKFLIKTCYLHNIKKRVFLVFF
jgi:hypothetical protein